MQKYLDPILFFLVCVPAMAGTIDSYTEKNPAEDGDYIVVRDGDDGSTKKVNVSNLPSSVSAAGGWTDGGTNVYLTASTDSVGMGTQNTSSK